jgi:hypothetical protein
MPQLLPPFWFDDNDINAPSSIIYTLPSIVVCKSGPGTSSRLKCRDW